MARELVIDADDVVNGLGIAQRLGVSKAAVSQWRTRHADFPHPLDLPGVVGIPLYYYSEVFEWYEARAYERDNPGRTMPLRGARGC